MATVYLAIQENFQREVALKVMSPVLTESGDFSERFLREARIVSRLVHPHIVTVHDVGIQNGHHYLSMEYIEGLDLKERLASLNGEQLLRVLAEVAKALDYAGRKGYVHRDVKPENIMIHNQDGRAVLMDFGIARAADSVSTMTRTGTALGTPHYMSPEQARGHPVDGRSDLYSLGVLLHFMLTGRVPYEADSPVAVGIKHVSAALPQLPAELASYQFLIDKLMAKKPEERFQTGSELVVALQHLDSNPIDQWRPRQGFEYLGSHEHTPLRSDQVNLVAEKSGTAAAATNAMAATGRSFSSADLPTGETIHIPREDLDARRVVRQGNGWLPVVLLLVVVAAGGGYYLYHTGVIKLPPALLALLPQEQRTGGAQPASKEAGNRPASDQQSGDRLAATDASASGAGDGVASDVARPAPADDLADDPVEELLQRSRQLTAVVDQQPERMPELLGIYRQVLLLEPEQAEAVDSLAQLQQEALSVARIQLDLGEMADARQSLDAALAWFPELSDDTRYTQLEQRFNTTQSIAELLPKAQEYLQRDRLLQPEGDNAKTLFEQVLALDADNEQAMSGLQSIVKRYGVLAESAIKRQDYANAQRHLKNGLSIDPSNRRLLGINKTLSAARQQQRTIDQLLTEADTLTQQQRWFGVDGAAQKYRQVLAMNATNRAAQQGLVRVLDDFAEDIEGLVAIRDYELAASRVDAALAAWPDNQQLQLLQQQLQSLAPAIDQLAISGRELSDDVETLARRVSADRTLYIAFEFRNLDQPTTVLQAILFDGGRSMQIAGVPVVVVGGEGRTQFRIDRPVEGFTAGGYHIDILLAGVQIFSHSFVIENN